jgi:TRAP-type C4-dicarboxylate transport system permease small subunit
MNNALSKIRNAYVKALRSVVITLIFVSGLSVFVMILITCADVILRRFGFPVAGAYDIVKLLSAITLACALPYTTAVKGHVAIEFFFHKLGRRSRLAVDSVMRCISSSLFAFLAYRSFHYGLELYRNGQVTQTLQLPVFWIAHVIGVCCLVVMLVILYNLVNPNREMIKL